MSEQRSELIKLFGSLHNAVNEKPWDQFKVSKCLLDITTKFDYEDAKVKNLEAKLQVAVEALEFLTLEMGFDLASREGLLKFIYDREMVAKQALAAIKDA